MGIVVAVVAVVALLAAYATWTAGRLDRLHARIDAAAAALDAQLRRRAEAAAVFAGVAALLPAVTIELTQAVELAGQAQGLGHEREAVENRVSRALQSAATTSPRAFDRGAPAVAALVDEATRATFARRFHNDAVRDGLVVRRRRVVRWLRLAGRAPQPSYFEIDDSALPSQASVAAGSPYD